MPRTSLGIFFFSLLSRQEFFLFTYFFDVMKKEKTTRSLLGAWVCELANKLYNESEKVITRTEAFRRAHRVRELLESLGMGKVTFRFEKLDGGIRVATGTLCKGIDPEFDKVVEERRSKERRSKEEDSLNFTYWDLEKHGFRTFSAARNVRIIEVVIPSKEEKDKHVSPDLIEFV